MLRAMLHSMFSLSEVSHAHTCCSHAYQHFSMGDRSGLLAGQGSTRAALATMTL